MGLALVAALILVVGAGRHGVTKADADVSHPSLPSARLQADPVWGQVVAAPEDVISLSGASPLLRVPTSYFGLSTEYWSLPRYEQRPEIFNRVLGALRPWRDGPLVLRIGGDSADHTFWRESSRLLSEKTFSLTPAWFRRVSKLVRADHLRVILDLNLMADAPQMAARVARAAIHELPHGSLVGFEIGNEPNLYHGELFYRLMSLARTGLRLHRLPAGVYSAGSYAKSFAVYARALGRAAPGVPLMGPEIANTSRALTYLSRLVRRDKRELGIASAHRYPLSACVPRDSTIYATVPRLLSSVASAGMAESVRRAVMVAHEHGLRFRLTEFNSVTCGGRRGVSNAFATALWAPDALFNLLKVGVDGVNVHVRGDAINAPFLLTHAGITARPLLYGLVLFARMLGPRAELMNVPVSSTGGPPLEVWAVRLADGTMHVLLIDKTRAAATVALREPGGGTATVERLLGPSATATSGVTLDGQWLTSDATWTGLSTAERIIPAGGSYQVTMPAMSAALFSLPR
jgi:hypothetical protein